MDKSQRLSVMTAGDYVHLARTYWRTLIGAAATGLVIGVLLTFIVPPTYSSTAEVLVSQVSTDTGPVANGRSSGMVNLDTEVQIASSIEVADVADVELNWPEEPRDLLRRLTVTVPANTSVLVFGFTAPTPEAAQTGANAFAAAYLANRSRVEDETVTARVEYIDEQIADLESSRTPDQAQIASLRTERAQLLSSPATAGRIIAPAELPEGPESPKKSIFALIGLVLGLLVGVTIAYVRWRRSDTLNDRQDIERAAGMPVAAAVPSPQAVLQSRSEHDRWSRGIRTVSLGLAGAAGTVNHRVVSVLGIGTDANLSFAQDLTKTLESRGLKCVEYQVIDESLRNPTAVSPEMRASAARTGRAELAALRQTHDLVLLTSAQLPTALDLLEVAQLGDATVLLAQTGSPEAPTLEQVATGLDQLSIPVVAVLAVDPTQSGAGA